MSTTTETTRVGMETWEPIVPLADIWRIGPSSDPWRQLITNINSLCSEGVFDLDDRSTIQDQVRLALSAKDSLGILTRISNSSASPYGPLGRTGSDELYYRHAELLFLQFEVFRLVRRILKWPHSHIFRGRACDGVCPALLILHILLTRFREENRATEFAETTLVDTRDGPLHMHPRLMAWRRAMIREGNSDPTADLMARYVAKISAHSIDDEEWEECVQQIILLRLNNPYDRSFWRGQNRGYQRIQGEGGEDDNSLGGFVVEDVRNISPHRDRNGNYHHREHSHRSSRNNLSNSSVSSLQDSSSDTIRNPRNRMPSFEAELSRLHTRPLPIDARTRSPSSLQNSSPFINSPVDSLETPPSVSLPNHQDPRFNSRRGANLTDFLRSAPSRHFIPRSRSQDITESPFAMPTPGRRISRSTDMDEVPLSPTSRPPTASRLDPTGRRLWFHEGALGFLTQDEESYMEWSEVARVADQRGASLQRRRELAARMQESLDRIGGTAGVAREEGWDERARLMGEFERGRGEWIDWYDQNEDDGDGEEASVITNEGRREENVNFID